MACKRCVLNWRTSNHARLLSKTCDRDSRDQVACVHARRARLAFGECRRCKDPQRPLRPDWPRETTAPRVRPYESALSPYQAHANTLYRNRIAGRTMKRPTRMAENRTVLKLSSFEICRQENLLVHRPRHPRMVRRVSRQLSARAAIRIAKGISRGSARIAGEP
jgi:hypothetical protein